VILAALLSGAMGLVGTGALAAFMGLLLVYVAFSVPYWNYVAAHMPKR
jgi:hypothetical protein